MGERLVQSGLAKESARRLAAAGKLNSRLLEVLPPASLRRTGCDLYGDRWPGRWRASADRCCDLLRPSVPVAGCCRPAFGGLLAESPRLPARPATTMPIVAGFMPRLLRRWELPRSMSAVAAFTVQEGGVRQAKTSPSAQAKDKEEPGSSGGTVGGSRFGGTATATLSCSGHQRSPWFHETVPLGQGCLDPSTTQARGIKQRRVSALRGPSGLSVPWFLLPPSAKLRGDIPSRFSSPWEG